MRNRQWTPLVVAIWLSALIAVITLGTLRVTNVIGSWALLVGSAIAVVVSLLGLREETKQAKRSTE